MCILVAFLLGLLWSSFAIRKGYNLITTVIIGYTLGVIWGVCFQLALTGSIL